MVVLGVFSCTNFSLHFCNSSIFSLVYFLTEWIIPKPLPHAHTLPLNGDLLHQSWLAASPSGEGSYIWEQLHDCRSHTPILLPKTPSGEHKIGDSPSLSFQK